MKVTADTLRFNLKLLLLCLLAGAVVGLSRGQANWWDLINYHIYNPWSLLNHRYNKDLFVAGIQTYFDPIADIPYYLVSMVWLRNHPVLVGALAGLPFGTLIFATLCMARTALRGYLPASSWAVAGVLTATVTVAVTGTSTWAQAVTTSNEVTVAIPVLFAITLLIDTFSGEKKTAMTVWRAASIGALLGLAAGLKLTAATYAPAGGLILLVACREWRHALRMGAVFFLAWLVAFSASYGPWAWHLCETTGNPFFPMFNNIFHSPLSSPHGWRPDTRFLPENILEWLFYPLYWLDDSRRTVFPHVFRDARFAVAYLLILASLITSVLHFVRKRRINFTPRSSLIAFWLISYVVWVYVFSMLRYAIVLEVSASIVSVGILVPMVNSIAGRLRRAIGALTAMVVAATFAAAMIFFAHIPDLGHVEFGDRTFTANVPALGPHPLVILGNQPMGLLAPLIEEKNPSAHFIGIASCFNPNDWCYESFYKYGLGKRMLSMIAKHNGNIYVAYYADKIPQLPQLREFKITSDMKHCMSMQTNRTQDIILCPAEYNPSGILTAYKTQKYHLAADIRPTTKNVNVKASWKFNSCTQKSMRGALKLHWSVPNDTGLVYVYVQSPPSSKRLHVARGPSTGTATTKRWVHAAQIFTLSDRKHRTLAYISIHYATCTKSDM